MFNQEQLAAIAAAMSIIQSMQPNATNGTTPTVTPNTSSIIPTSNTLETVQQQLAAAWASSGRPQPQPHHQQQQQQQHQHQSQIVGNANLGFQQSQLAAGLASLASLEAALPTANDHLPQHLSARHIGTSSAPTTNSDTSQHALVNQYCSQFGRSDLNLSPSPPKLAALPTNLRLDEHQQQILLNQLRAIQYLQQQHQQQDLHNLTNSPPKTSQQQHQNQNQQQHQQQQQQQLHQQHQQEQQKALINQYQVKMQQQTDVHIMAPSSPNRPQPLAPLTQQQAPQQLNQHNSGLNQNKQQQQSDSKHQTSTQIKANRPISYSAIVAKSAGLAPNNNNINNNNNSSISNVTNHTTNNSTLSFANSINDNATNNLNSMASHSHSKTANLATTNNTFGGLNHSSGLSNSTSTFSATTNHHMSASESDPMNKFSNYNGTGNINGHSLRSAHQLNAPNSIVRNPMNNHIANHSTNDDIFNTNNLTSSLGQTNGSSLLKQHNNLLSLETTLDNYTTDNPTSPAHRLYNQPNHSFRQNQMPTNIVHQQIQQHQNHRSTNTDIVLSSPNSRDKNTPSHGRATNLLGFMGLYVGNLSPDLTKEQLEKIFSKYGEPVKAHRLIRSPVAFIKYENTESPRAAIDDLYGLLLPELTLNQDQPLKLHFDRNDVQLKANYRPTELPKEDNGECYGWRTTVCRRGKNCPKKHIPINRGIDFQMWMIKSNLAGVTGGTPS